MSTASSVWSVRVDWTDPDAPPTYLEDLTEALAPFSASISADSANYCAQLTLEEPKPLTLRAATTKALTTVENAARSLGRACVPLGLEVLTWEQFEYRLQLPSIPELVGLTEIAQMAGAMSRQRAAQLAALPGFPPPVVRTAGRPLFVRAQVKAWLETWDRRTGRPPKPTTDDNTSPTSPTRRRATTGTKPRAGRTNATAAATTAAAAPGAIATKTRNTTA